MVCIGIRFGSASSKWLRGWKLTASLTLCFSQQRGADGGSCSRRAALSAGTLGAAALLLDRPAQAVQGLTAGRIPGSSRSQGSMLQNSSHTVVSSDTIAEKVTE